MLIKIGRSLNIAFIPIDANNPIEEMLKIVDSKLTNPRVRIKKSTIVTM